jgi:hypothetical protein
MEVDLDLHTYSYLARKAIMTYVNRLPYVIWDNAFVIQVSGSGCDLLLLLCDIQLDRHRLLPCHACMQLAV